MNKISLPQSESKSIEFKRWLDPSVDKSTEKMLKAFVSIRNINGGKLIIGLNNDGTFNNQDSQLSDKYDYDKIQTMISNHVYEPFEVSFQKYDDGNSKALVISVPSGIETPCLFKKSLVVAGDEKIKKDVLYLRTLSSNGTYSSSEAKYSDWQDVFEICFVNREAKIADFIRKNFDTEKLIEGLKVLRSASDSILKTNQEKIIEYVRIADQEWKTHQLVIGSKIFDQTQKEMEFGTQFVMCFPLDFSTDKENNRTELTKVLNSNPRLTGWPSWTDTPLKSRFEPEIRKGRWEYFSLMEVFSFRASYWTIDLSTGIFSLIEPLEEDFLHRSPQFSNLEPLRHFSPEIAIREIIDPVIVSINYYKTLGVKSGNILFVFGWTRLINRLLSNFSYESNHSGKCVDAPELIYLSISIDVNEGVIIPFVNKIINKLIMNFSGASVSEEDVRKIYNHLMKNK